MFVVSCCAVLCCAVYGWMLERMPSMRNIQVCNALFAMGKLNLYNAELCDSLLKVCMSGFWAARVYGSGRLGMECWSPFCLCLASRGASQGTGNMGYRPY